MRRHHRARRVHLGEPGRVVIPLGAERVAIDPTVVSGPLITTLVDASGLFTYLSIAKLTVSALANH